MKIDYSAEGIGRVIASGYAMRHCISFLKSVYPKRFRWIKRNGIDFDMVYAVNYDLRDKWIDEAMKTNHQENECKPNCSFCKSDKEHYQQMSEFFDEMIEHINFHIFVGRCSRCGKPECSNVGIISEKTVFAFCVDCRTELTLKQNAARAASERIGA